ncbi:MAG: hypothetical protein IPJ30_21515 [Acidobacteria bacterium]|nr:hypothetical protein [Acidobacteriota bacterium]
MYPKLRPSRPNILIFALFGIALSVMSVFWSVKNSTPETATVTATNTVSHPLVELETVTSDVAPTLDRPLNRPTGEISRKARESENLSPQLPLIEPEITFDFKPSNKWPQAIPTAQTDRGKLEEGRPEEANERTRGDRPIEAQGFRNMQLQDDVGEIPADGLQKAREQVEVMRSLQQSKAVAAGKPEGQEIAGITPGQWTWLGPGNIGGRIRTIVIDPSNPNRMWIGSVSGGIWHSTNAGGTWSPVNDFMANLAVSTMVIDPTNSNILYAGTGESFSAGLDATEGESNTSKQRGDGVFKSVDGGITWNQLARTNTADPTVCAAAGPICPWSYVNRLTISRDGTAIIAATLTGIFRSIDGGATDADDRRAEIISRC